MGRTHVKWAGVELYNEYNDLKHRTAHVGDYSAKYAEIVAGAAAVKRAHSEPGHDRRPFFRQSFGLPESNQRWQLNDRLEPEKSRPFSGSFSVRRRWTEELTSDMLANLSDVDGLSDVTDRDVTDRDVSSSTSRYSRCDECRCKCDCGDQGVYPYLPLVLKMNRRKAICKYRVAKYAIREEKKRLDSSIDRLRDNQSELSDRMHIQERYVPYVKSIIKGQNSTSKLEKKKHYIVNTEPVEIPLPELKMNKKIKEKHLKDII